jgi:hypothetical protein
LVHANSSNGSDQKTVRISSNFKGETPLQIEINTKLSASNPIGSDALKLVREKIDSLAGEITAWEDVTLSTDTEGDDCVLYMTTDGRYGEQAHVKRSKALSRLALLRFAGLSQINPKSQSECSGLNWRIRPGKAPDPVSVAALRRLTSLWVTPSLLADP